MQTILDLVKPKPEAKWVVFYSLGDGADGGRYYDAHPIEQMRYHLTMLAYDMNGEPLSYGHGAPLRLRNEVQLGFKQVKWIAGIEFVADYLRGRRRLRRLQRRPRVLRVSAVDLSGSLQNWPGTNLLPEPLGRCTPAGVRSRGQDCRRITVPSGRMTAGSSLPASLQRTLPITVAAFPSFGRRISPFPAPS